MRLTKPELQSLKYIFNKNTVINTDKNNNLLSSKINKSKSQVYRILQSLTNKHLIYKSKKELNIYKSEFTIQLGKAITTNENLIDLFSGNGLDILASLINKHTIKEIVIDTDYNKDNVYQKIKQAMALSLIWPEKEKYYINEDVWPNIKKLLSLYKEHNILLDDRIPINSIVYLHNKSETIFSNPDPNLTAELTSFSLFYKYNIKIYNLTNYYYLPKKTLTKKDLLLHTLKIVEKTKDFRDILYLALFYFKYKGELKDIIDPILINLNKIYNSSKIEGYPPLKEIKEKAEIYNIKL